MPCPSREHLAEAVETGFKVVGEFLSELNVLDDVGEALVAKPENVEACLSCSRLELPFTPATYPMLARTDTQKFQRPLKSMHGRNWGV